MNPMSGNLLVEGAPWEALWKTPSRGSGDRSHTSSERRTEAEDPGRLVELVPTGASKGRWRLRECPGSQILAILQDSHVDGGGRKPYFKGRPVGPMLF